MRRGAGLLIAAAVAAAGCGSRNDAVDAATTSTTVEPTTTTTATTTAPSTTTTSSPPPGGGLALPRCSEVPTVTPTEPAAPGDDHGAVVAMQQELTEEPWFGGTWLDGGAVLAVTADVEGFQRAVDDRFGEGVVRVVHVERSLRELEALQRSVVAYLQGRNARYGGVGVAVMQNVVDVHLVALEPQLVADIAAAVGTQGLCVFGADPADIPPEGPQPTHGDGWRLLADEPGVGAPYDTGFAGNRDELAALWSEVGLATEQPTIDFEREVVVWFGPAVSSSCSHIRLDDVVIDAEAATVRPVIVVPGGAAICSSDAGNHAYVVAIERDRLPERFTVDLGPGSPEQSRTEVDLAR